MIAAASAGDTLAGLLFLIAVLSVACLVMALFAWLEERRGDRELERINRARAGGTAGRTTSRR